MSITAIAFDGNGVLYYRDRDFGDELIEWIRTACLPGLDTARAAASHLRWMRSAFDGRIDKTRAMESFLDETGLSDPAMRRAVIERELELSRRITLFPGERETLLELSRRGFALGMITNSWQSAAEKASWFAGLGLDCIASNIVSSIDAGISKPDPGIYLEFCGRIGAEPGNVAFVGHEDFELRGAREAGMLPVSFACDPGAREVLHLEHFSDLLRLFPVPGAGAPLQEG